MPSEVNRGQSQHPQPQPQLSPEHGRSNPAKAPENWVTGEEPMTGAQASYLQALSEEAGVAFDPKLSKAEASRRIDESQGKTGRGR